MVRTGAWKEGERVTLSQRLLMVLWVVVGFSCLCFCVFVCLFLSQGLFPGTEQILLLQPLITGTTDLVHLAQLTKYDLVRLKCGKVH